jgi:uncharacterized protein (DUF58 family)
MAVFASQLFQRRRPASSVTTPVRRKPSIDISFTFLVYFGMMAFMGLAAMNSQANLLFGVFGLMIGILLVSHSISRIVLQKVRVRRVIPDHGTVGRPMSLTYEFYNGKRYWPTLSLCLAELDGAEGFTQQPQCYMLHAAPGMTATVPVDFIPKRRGLHHLDRYQLSTSFPFGFIKRATVRRHRDRVLIVPALARVDRKLLAMCRSAENTGATMRPRAGGADEFYGVKEYRRGENPRWIYWRRSARTGVIVSKEMTQVAPPRLLLLVDTFLTDRSAAEHVAVERTIAMAGSLASAALEDGLSVGLFVWTGEWTGLNPTRGKRHRDDVLSVLGRLPLNTARDTQVLMDASLDFLESNTTAILLTPREMRVGLAQRARGSMLVVSSNSPAADGWFRFDPGINFATCMPPDQQPKIEKSGARSQ